ncbi:MAG: WG repeat-containing protein [Firmicutes bacterium]|nr:WG repeat-containing protein [Bacillota bacterium]
MKKLLLILIATICSIVSIAQNTSLKPDYSDRKGGWGLLSAEGKYKVKPQFDAIEQIPDGFIVTKDGRQGFYDNEGEKIVKPEYTKLEDTPNFYLLALKDGKWGVVSKSGKVLVKPAYQTMSLTDRSHLCVTENGVASIINADGSYVMKGSGYSLLEPLGRGLIVAHSGIATGLIDESGKEIVPVGKFDSFRLGVADFVEVSSKGKKGFVNTATSPVTISPLYDDLKPLGSDLFIVKNGGKTGVITHAGKTVLQPLYDDVSITSIPSQSELFVLTLNGKKGWATREKVLAKPIYDDFAPDTSHGGVMMVKYDGYSYPTDINGSPSDYALIEPVGPELRRVYEGDTTFVKLVDRDFNTVFTAENSTVQAMGNVIVVEGVTGCNGVLLSATGKVIENINFCSAANLADDEIICLILPADTTDMVDDYVIKFYDYNGKEITSLPNDDEVQTKFQALKDKAVLKFAEIYRQRYPELTEEEVAEEVVAVEEVDPTAKSGYVDKVWVSHNVMDGGRKGMRIHVKFHVANCQYEDGQCVAWFAFSDGTRLKDFDGSYKTIDGQVSTSTKFRPGYENTVYEDLQLFIPYTQLHLTQKQNSDCMFHVGVFVNDEQLCTSNYVYFTFYPNGNVPKKKSSKKSTKKKRR